MYKITHSFYLLTVHTWWQLYLRVMGGYLNELISRGRARVFTGPWPPHGKTRRKAGHSEVGDVVVATIIAVHVVVALASLLRRYGDSCFRLHRQ